MPTEEDLDSVEVGLSVVSDDSDGDVVGEVVVVESVLGEDVLESSS